MTDDQEDEARLGRGDRQAAERKARLAAQLRTNLQRRKIQARARRAGEADERPEGLMDGPGEDRT